MYIQQFQLSYSAAVGIKNNLTIAMPWVLLNMLIVALPLIIGLLVTKHVKWAVLINNILITVLSLLNYHILLFHGSPFLAGDIFSLRTAWNVASEYTFVLDGIVKRLIIIFCIEIIVWYMVYQKLLIKILENGIIKRKIAVLMTVLNLGCIYILFLSPFAIFDKGLITWSWESAMNEYGYGVCFCNSIYAIRNYCTKPENYNVGSIRCDDSDFTNEAAVHENPDIILILNESLADLDVYLNIEESRKIFSKINERLDIVHGYTVSSLIGGGTNNSEYELLTSNSMQVLNVSSPFLSMDMRKSVSIVDYLNSLNYTTVGMHCGNASNYNRNNAYKEMGFDAIRLGKKDFDLYNQNGSHPWLDTDNYKEMIEIYESCDDNPRFMYLLTYQNHGGYEQNDDSEDQILVEGDYGDYTDDINEYLSSVDKSIDAFIELINYFEDLDRDVVIMMLGDHGPAFISNLTSDKELTSEQQEIAKRTIPYYVWSNMEMETEVFSEYESMVDLVPLMLKSTGMSLTGYYKTIIDLNEKVPVRTVYGSYIDDDGNIGTITSDYEHYNLIQNYYYLEYNNLHHSDDYNEAWFKLKNR